MSSLVRFYFSSRRYKLLLLLLFHRYLLEILIHTSKKKREREKIIIDDLGTKKPLDEGNDLVKRHGPIDFSIYLLAIEVGKNISYCYNVCYYKNWENIKLLFNFVTCLRTVNYVTFEVHLFKRLLRIVVTGYSKSSLFSERFSS